MGICFLVSILQTAQEWFRELAFSRLECGVHDRLHVYPCVGYFTSSGIDTREKAPCNGFSVSSEIYRDTQSESLM